MNAIFNLAMSVNGFDDYGHYLRTALLAGCNSLGDASSNQACSANFIEGASAATARASSRKPRRRSSSILPGEDPKKVLAEYGAATAASCRSARRDAPQLAADAGRRDAQASAQQRKPKQPSRHPRRHAGRGRARLPAGSGG